MTACLQYSACFWLVDRPVVAPSLILDVLVTYGALPTEPDRLLYAKTEELVVMFTRNS